MEKEYYHFFFQGVVKIIGNKNSKPYSREIKQKQQPIPTRCKKRLQAICEPISSKCYGLKK